MTDTPPDEPTEPTDTPPPAADGGGGDGERVSVQLIEIQDEMERSFLEYAMSVIMARALPDARDGLKPVHRRILWSMINSGFTPNRAHVKCSRVVGDVMANFHPHGDSAIYDALVRMAQPFSLRDPLIDFHGNYGSPEFGPAASRYTECRLSPLAMRLLDGIDENTVDFTPNYDGTNSEPLVMPARFPNLLVNGSQGIAVGMATNIPPHNLGEVIDATVHLIDNPEATPDDLMQFVRGPDFPTGAQILGRAGILDAYRTGRGSVRMRADAEIEETRRGMQITVTALPYQSSAGAIAVRIKELVDSRELDGIRDINDESSGDQTRLVIELKRDANPNVVLNNLYKHTQLQTSFGVNMVALVDGVPRTLNLAGMLQAYVNHQIEVIRRRSEYRLEKARARAHILEGRLRALDVIDAIIALIRGSEDRAAARTALQAEPFSFSEIQAEDLLDMRLAQLTRLSRADIEAELAAKRIEIAELESILADERKLRQVIKDELAEIRAEFATDRKARLVPDPGEMAIEDLVDDKELVVTMTQAGYIKSVEAQVFRTQGRGGRGISGTRLRDEDVVTTILHTSAHAYLLFFTNIGRVYRLRAHEVPERERTARGIPIVNLLELQAGEHVQAVIDTRDYETNRYLFFATRNGTVKKTRFTEYDSSLRRGIIALDLRDGDELVRVIPTNGSDDIIMLGRSGQAIRFNEDDVRPMGRAAAGVRGMRLRQGDEVVSCDVVREGADLLIVTAAGYGKRTDLDDFRRIGRGNQGVRGIRITEQRGGVAAAMMVGPDDDVIMVSSGGVTIRTSVAEISQQGRDATGVRIMNVGDDEHVAAVALVLQSDEANGDDAADLDAAEPGDAEPGDAGIAPEGAREAGDGDTEG
ncbi:MAG: DNA gyrase subunit A [Acidimicrobiales bacterium]|nr:DNA gyrase subunit A [Acidimicrobiales bacterium]